MIEIQRNQTNDVTLNCEAIGEPVPIISWYFNDIKLNLSNTSKYNISNLIKGNVSTSSFVIINAMLSDVGIYACYAENTFGGDQNSITLAVNGKTYLL